MLDMSKKKYTLMAIYVQNKNGDYQLFASRNEPDEAERDVNNEED